MTNRISRLKTACLPIPVKSRWSVRCFIPPATANRRRTGDIAPGESNSVYPEHVEISIRDEELIAGNRTVNRAPGLCRRKWTLTGC